MCIIYYQGFVFFRKFHTISAKEWTTVFRNELSSTPILVCLTHADKLCEESDDYMKLFTADECKETKRVQDMTRRFDLELQVNVIVQYM